MSDNPKYKTVQATRSFNEYIQGATYLIDTADEGMLALLGAGYFHEEYNPALEIGPYADSAELFPGNPATMAEQEHVNVEAGYQPANDVQVPEKMTGSQRATTADEEQANGTVGTEPTSDSGSRTQRRASARKSGGSGNN